MNEDISSQRLKLWSKSKKERNYLAVPRWALLWEIEEGMRQRILRSEASQRRRAEGDLRRRTGHSEGDLWRVQALSEGILDWWGVQWKPRLRRQCLWTGEVRERPHRPEIRHICPMRPPSTPDWIWRAIIPLLLLWKLGWAQMPAWSHLQLAGAEYRFKFSLRFINIQLLKCMPKEEEYQPYRPKCPPGTRKRFENSTDIYEVWNDLRIFTPVSDESKSSSAKDASDNDIKRNQKFHLAVWEGSSTFENLNLFLNSSVERKSKELIKFCTKS